MGFDTLPDLGKVFGWLIVICLLVGGGCGACGMHGWKKYVSDRYSLHIEVLKK